MENKIWMKKCIKCNQLKFINGFHLNVRTKDQHSPWCKTCTLEAKREWRKKNPDRSREINRNTYYNNIEHYREQSLKYAARKRKEWERVLKKEQKECATCGYNKCPAALDFHHIDKSTKSMNISTFCDQKTPNDQNKKMVLQA